MKEKWQSSAAAISLSSSGICRHLSALFHPCQHGLAPYRFNDPNSLADWLELHDFFDCGCAANFLPPPSEFNSEIESPANVSFELGLSVGGSYDAGQLRKVERFRFSGYHVQQWSANFIQKDYALDGLLIDGVEVDDDKQLIDILIDGNIHLQCSSIEIELLPEATIVNRPLVTTRTAVVHFPNTVLPNPAQWLQWLAEIGAACTWRQNYGDAVRAESLPQDDYEGWFMQAANLVDSTTSGVMLKTLKQFDGGFFAELDDWNQPEEPHAYSPMWRLLSQVAASKPHSSVRCGNCLLTGPEWLESLDGGDHFLSTLNFEKRIKSRVPNGWFPHQREVTDPLPSRTIYPGSIATNFGLWPYKKAESPT